MEAPKESRLYLAGLVPSFSYRYPGRNGRIKRGGEEEVVQRFLCPPLFSSLCTGTEVEKGVNDCAEGRKRKTGEKRDQKSARENQAWYKKSKVIPRCLRSSSLK